MLYFLCSLFYNTSLPPSSICALWAGLWILELWMSPSKTVFPVNAFTTPQKSKNIILYIWDLFNTDNRNFCFSPETCFSIVFSTSLNGSTMYLVSCSRHKPRNDSQFSFPSSPTWNPHSVGSVIFLSKHIPCVLWLHFQHCFLGLGHHPLLLSIAS